MRYPLVVLLFLLMSFSAYSAEIWFQPSRGMGMGARSYAVICGEFPKRGHHCSLRGVKVLLKDYSGKVKTLRITRSRRGFCVRVRGAIYNGNYTLVAFKKEQKNGETLYYYAKLNFYVRHQKEPKVKAANDDLKPFGSPIALELIRWRNVNQEPFFISRVGRRVHFKVYFEGKPLAGVPIKVITASGWSKTVVSDEDGNIEFTLIEDRFPPRKYRWRPEMFLLVATYKNGNDTYVSTYPMRVYISPDAYRSKEAGVIILIVVMLVAGVWAYFRRKEKKY